MSTASEILAGLRDALAARGAQDLAGRAYGVHLNGSNAVMPLPDVERLTLPAAAAAVSRAYLAVAGFAQDARVIESNPRLSAGAKQEDQRELAVKVGATVRAELTAAGDALAAAELVESRETAPLPIEPANAADAVTDGELRGLLRGMPLADQMQRVRDDMASCRALLRLPVGFDEQAVAYARACWAKFNPSAPTATQAQRAVESWRAARAAIGAAEAALLKLSAGRSSGTVGPARAA